MRDPSELVTLRNGAQEVKALVAVTLLSLRSLMNANPIAFYELVMFARDRTHQFFGDSYKPLLELHLLEGAPGAFRVHDSLRNVILSAVTGDGLGMTLGNPIA